MTTPSTPATVSAPTKTVAAPAAAPAVAAVATPAKAAPVAKTPVKKAAATKPAKAPAKGKTAASKATAKPVAAKPAAAPAKKAAPKTAAPKANAKAAPKVAAKEEKAKKPKLVRDSFTIPKAEYLVLDTLKERALKLSREVKKSELLRAGIKALAALSDAALLAALTAVPAIKTGRPAAEKPAPQDKPAKKVRSTKR